MKRHLLAAAAAVVGLALGTAASAQNIVVTNARILDGTGKSIPNGTIVARDGRIVSVSATPPAAAEVKGYARIDAKGMTVLPAYIDAHRHIFQGPAPAWLADKAPAYMKSFLDAGFTTVFSMGDDVQGILDLRSRLASGQMAGPRLYAAKMLPLAKGFGEPAVHEDPLPPPYNDPGRTDTARPPARPVKSPEAFTDAEIRAMIVQAKQQGFDAIKNVLIATPGGVEGHALTIVVDEAHKQGLRTYTHATNYLDTLTAVNAKTDVLAHTPHIGQLEENPAAIQFIAKSGIAMVSTLQVFVPHFDEQNRPLYRDGGAFPMPRPLSSAGQGPVNARLLWDNGTVYAYGTDTQWDPLVTLKDELRALSLTFSPRDILKIMGPNSAAAINKSADLGTLEPGKLADIVIVNGDPLDDIFNLTRVVAVVKDGKVAVNKLTPPKK
jgi:enamidase